MKVLAAFLAATLLSLPAFADAPLKGECIGWTKSGLRVTAQFCIPSGAQDTLVPCYGGKKTQVVVWAGYAKPRILNVKYSTVANEEDALDINAYDTPLDLIEGNANVKSFSAQGVIDNPTGRMHIQLGNGWNFAFANASCSFKF